MRVHDAHHELISLSMHGTVPPGFVELISLSEAQSEEALRWFISISQKSSVRQP